MIKDINGLPKQTTPKMIIHQGEIVRSPRTLANIASTHYIDNVNMIPLRMKPIYIYIYISVCLYILHSIWPGRRQIDATQVQRTM